MTWQKVKLGEACVIEKGKVGIQKAIPGKYPLVVTGEQRLSHNEYHFDRNAVIVPLVSSTGHGHKSLKRIHFQTGKFAVGNILCAIIPKDETFLKAEYLYRYLNLNKEQELVRRMKGMANVSLPIKEIEKIEIPVPPLENQIHFIAKYQKLENSKDELTIELTHQQNLLRQLRQAFLRKAMQGKLTAEFRSSHPELVEGSNSAGELLKRIKAEKEKLVSEKKLKKEKPLPPIKAEEIPFDIPKNWVWCRLGEIISYSENLDIQKRLSEDTIINYIDIDSIDNQNQTIREVKQKKVSELSTRARRVLKSKYILYSTVRPYLKNIAIIENDLPNYIGSTGFNVFKTILVELKFVFYFLLSPKINETYKKMMIGFNSPSISNDQFENTLFPLPSLLEQNRIVKKLDELMKLCDEVQESIETGKKQNAMLMESVLREALREKIDND